MRLLEENLVAADINVSAELNVLRGKKERNYRVIFSLEAVSKFGKSIPEFGETHSSVLGCERRPVSASIMSRSCFASFFHFDFSFSFFIFKSLSQ